MGVTMARKAVKGGEGYDAAEGGSYNLGESLTKHVKVFIGMGGANEGLTDCYSQVLIPVCGATNGN